MADEALPPLLLDAAVTGSVGPQVTASPADVSAIVKSYAPGTLGLQSITTAEQMVELARSGLPPETKAEMLGAMLLGAQQARLADVQHRFDLSEKEVGRLRRQLSDVKDDLAEARGDVRVRDQQIVNLKEHRRRDTLLLSISSILFGVGGAFIGRSLAAAIVGFAAGLALFVFVLLDRPARSGGAK